MSLNNQLGFSKITVYSFLKETDAQLCDSHVTVIQERHKMELNSALLTISHHLPFKLHCAIALMATTLTTVHCLKA